MKLMECLQRAMLIFFTSLGVVLGSALVGSLAAVFTGEPPVRTMIKLAYDIKIWAMVAAIGGTFTTLEILQIGLFEGQVLTVVKQLFFLFCAFMGAQMGYFLITVLAGGN